MPCVVAHLLAHHLAQRLDLERIGLAEIEEEIGVQFAHLRVAEREATAPGRVDQLPARMAIGILEGRPAGLGLGRLRAFALFGDLAHAGEDVVRVAGKALVDRRGEHRAARAVRLAVEVAHVGIGERDDLALAGHGAQLDHAVARLGAVAAGVHVERPADAARDAAIEGQPVNPRFGGGRRDLDVRQRRAGAEAVIVEDFDRRQSPWPRAG